LTIIGASGADFHRPSMKQNSSILFHPMLKALRIRYFRSVFSVSIVAIALFVGASRGSAAEKPEYVTSFDPAKGFKPAQTDLTEIYLQIAGSLEYYGSAEPYLWHVVKEHARIEALYLQKTGRAPKTYRPDYMTDAYIDRLSSNWKSLSPALGLESFAKGIGNTMRDAIKGTRGTGTIIVQIFNRHQKSVFDSMAGKGTGTADFEVLRAELTRQLELDKESVDEERYEISRRDAVSFALGIQGRTLKLFKRVDAGLKPADAERIKTVLTSIFMDVGEMADSELKAGIAEWSFEKLSAAAK
jgi:hypothetical protein